jgi:hypothetical protein
MDEGEAEGDDCTHEWETLEDKEVAQLDAMEVRCRQALYSTPVQYSMPTTASTLADHSIWGLLQGERDASEEQRSRLQRS